MNLAVVLRAPAIFVYEDNGYGEHTGADYAIGAETLRADSTDEMMAAMEALKQAGSMNAELIVI